MEAFVKTSQDCKKMRFAARDNGVTQATHFFFILKEKDRKRALEHVRSLR